MASTRGIHGRFIGAMWDPSDWPQERKAREREPSVQVTDEMATRLWIAFHGGDFSSVDLMTPSYLEQYKNALTKALSVREPSVQEADEVTVTLKRSHWDSLLIDGRILSSAGSPSMREHNARAEARAALRAALLSSTREGGTE